MKHLIILTVYTKPGLTSRCLAALARTTDLRKNKLVIVDDHSSQRIRSSLERFRERHPSVEIIRNTRNLGKPRSLNLALNKYPRARYYTVLDNDVFLHTRGWVEILERCHVDWHDQAILGAYTYMTGFKFRKNGRTYLDPWPYWTLAGCFFSFSGLVFRRIGYFFDQSARSEDADYCRRAYLAGFRWYYTTAIKATISGYKGRAERQRQLRQRLRGQRVRRRWGDHVMTTHRPFYAPRKDTQRDRQASP